MKKVILAIAMMVTMSQAATKLEAIEICENGFTVITKLKNYALQGKISVGLAIYKSKQQAAYILPYCKQGGYKDSVRKINTLLGK